MSSGVILSIVIPAYEEDGIHKTLINLANQYFFQNYGNKYIEILVVDYDPNNTKKTEDSIKFFSGVSSSNNNNNSSNGNIIRIIPIKEKGIAKARHIGITMSSGRIILNFDADARFAQQNGLGNLIDPILRRGYSITCCDNVLDELEFGNLDLGERVAAIAIYQTLSTIQKDNPIVTLEPGFCFTADSYYKSGGFFDVTQGEAIVFSPKLIYQQGLFSKIHVPSNEATVIVSPRRVNAIFKRGLVTALNYDNAFRL